MAMTGDIISAYLLASRDKPALLASPRSGIILILRIILKHYPKLQDLCLSTNLFSFSKTRFNDKLDFNGQISKYKI